MIGYDCLMCFSGLEAF